MITMHCRCQCPVSMIYLYGGSEVSHLLNTSLLHCDANLPIKVKDIYEGTFQCQCLLTADHRNLSSPSNPIQIHVRDKPSPPIVSIVQGSASPEGDTVIITCRGEIRSRGGIFYLYKSHFRGFTQLRRVTVDEQSVNFTVSVTGKEAAGNYSCLYQTEISGHPIASSFSESVTIAWKQQDNNAVTLVHLCLSLFVLITLTVIIIEHFTNGSPLTGERKDLRKRSVHVFTTGV
ncbi:uncharacterized protein [Chiloscyllium punctatum]|uniref:uncharacterized protein n=1 Tax=Chiloscyllium punctatum TaxID=137246 RepID=UPI003B63F617